MFSQNLKYLRNKHDMEQIDLAHKLGKKSASSISEWEKGKYTPKMKTLKDISDIFSLEDGIYGKSILNNSSIKTFFSLEEENIKILEKYTNLSEKEKIEIKSLKRGECLTFVGDEHILNKIYAADFEKEIIENKIENNENK